MFLSLCNQMELITLNAELEANTVSPVSPKTASPLKVPTQSKPPVQPKVVAAPTLTKAQPKQPTKATTPKQKSTEFKGDKVYKETTAKVTYSPSDPRLIGHSNVKLLSDTSTPKQAVTKVLGDPYTSDKVKAGIIPKPSKIDQDKLGQVYQLVQGQLKGMSDKQIQTYYRDVYGKKWIDDYTISNQINDLRGKYVKAFAQVYNIPVHEAQKRYDQVNDPIGEFIRTMSITDPYANKVGGMIAGFLDPETENRITGKR